MVSRTIAATAAAAMLVASATAQDTFVYNDFEVNSDTFHLPLSYSGSTRGIDPERTRVQRTRDESFSGQTSQRLSIVDELIDTNWFVRHISSSQASRTQNVIRPTEGYVGFWAKTEDPDLEIAMAIDNTDNVTADRGVLQPLVPDGQWHLYEWNLEDDDQWEAWVNGDGVIDTPDFTLDSIQIHGPDEDVTIYLDRIAHNQFGHLLPASAEDHMWRSQSPVGVWDIAANWDPSGVPSAAWSANLDNTSLPSGQTAHVTVDSTVDRVSVHGTVGPMILQIESGATLAATGGLSVAQLGAIAGGGTLDGSLKNRGLYAIASVSEALHVVGTADIDGAALSVTGTFQHPRAAATGDVTILTAIAISGTFATPPEAGVESHLGRGYFLESLEEEAESVRVNIVGALPGDANGDWSFDQIDIIEVLASGKYLTGQPADWTEGDWNDDGIVDQRDVIAALQTGNYLTGSYASVVSVPEPSTGLLLVTGLLLPLSVLARSRVPDFLGHASAPAATRDTNAMNISSLVISRRELGVDAFVFER